MLGEFSDTIDEIIDTGVELKSNRWIGQQSLVRDMNSRNTCIATEFTTSVTG